MLYSLNTLRHTQIWGRAFGERLSAGDLVALKGELGAGKTTLTQAVAAGMGIRDAVTSPTYTLIQEYSGPVPMYHLDPYRLDNPKEISELGLYDYLSRRGVVVIEWADLVLDLLPADRFEIELAMGHPLNGLEGDNAGRTLRLQVCGKARQIEDEFARKPEIEALLSRRSAHG